MKKEILIIFVLAVLATGLSWFVKLSPVVMPTGSPPVRGLPLPYWELLGARPPWMERISNLVWIEFASGIIKPIFLVVDFLFWFFVLWQVVKWIKGKVKKHD